MKRVLVITALLATTAVAGPKTKKPPDKFAKAASEAFIAAEAADTKGDHATALGLYNKAFDISPHPSTAYNIGDVERRANNLTEAIEWYEMYLLLAPNASDVKEVNALIAKLVAAPTILHLRSYAPSSSDSLDLASSYILIDGDIAKKAGEPVALDTANQPMIDLDSPSRDITVNVVSELTFARQVCNFERRRDKQECVISGPPRRDGSLVVDSNMDTPMGLWEVGKPNVDLVGKRTKLTPGKHKFMVRDRNIDCLPLTIDVPANNDIAYVFLRAEMTDHHDRCRDVEIIQRRLPFK